MKTETWNSFWLKTAAFLLGVLLLPLGAWYGTITVFAYADGWYGQTAPTFAESSVCQGAVYCQAEELMGMFSDVRSEKEAEEMAAYLSALDGSLRLAVYPMGTGGEAGETALYDGHSEDDVFVGEFWGGRYCLRLYLNGDGKASDSLYWAERFFEREEKTYGAAPYLTALCLFGLLVVFLYLARASGRRPGREEVVSGWQEKLPLDLYLAVTVTTVIVLLMLLAELLNGGVDFLFCEPPALLMLALLLVACEVLLQGTWMTVCVRGKLGKWWRNTLIYQLLRVLYRGLRVIWRGTVAAVRAIPLVWRTVLGATALAFLSAILLGNGAGGPFLLLSLILIAAAGAASLQLQKLRKGGQALAAGDLSYKVDTHRMFWDFRRHGEDLNAIGRGMRIAVEDQLKSERLKTELITNVSHDIKTPLTSIINYVDLLQKDHTPAQEHAYLLVLDRQARKLKKLTEDLVELSKAASGNLPCRPSRRNVRELIEQAVGEYSERLADAGLTPVVTLPEEELTCHADGALMWRVLDNLLSNACKYAQTGTRLYVDVRREGAFACFSFKNVSRDPLNVPAEELMERFVRGDSARSSEGSGLGLNIAGSLVELQGGQFRLFVDGDLFKAEFTVPLVGPSEENAPRNA